MDLDVTGKSVVVTGASKGIGLAIARAFAAEGGAVTMVSRTEDVLQERAREIADATGANVQAVSLDLSTEDGREGLFASHGDTDILVNNAGAIKAGRLSDLSMEDWRTGWELKVFGYIHLCKLFMDKMSERGEGTIINIVGMGGRAVRYDYICGAAGNAALIGFTNALGAGSPEHNVRVFGINPSPTMTDRIIDMSKARAKANFGDESRWEEMIDGTKFPFGRLKTAEEVAALSVMLASPKVHYLSGTVIDFDGGLQWRG
ncbi:MAG: short-chain dehydrogenase/reductase [Pseudomonadota bacterium]